MPEHPVAERARLLAEGTEAWARLRARLDADAERGSLHDPDSPAWSSREVYAHFARYQSHSLENLHRRLAGNDPLPSDGLDDDTRNERWAEADRALTVEEARDWCLATTEALRLAALALTPERWAEFGTSVADDVLSPHYLAHLEYIERADADSSMTR
ncbi:MAG: hypothetical protein R3C39_15785 [Dehalococcoidia bacterium]